VRKINENVTDPAYRMVRGMCTHMQIAVSDPRRATIMLRGHDWVSAGDHQLLSLTLCRFGLEEAEVVRIVSASARDIIKT
jgi:hypothetical protein